MKIMYYSYRRSCLVLLSRYLSASHCVHNNQVQWRVEKRLLLGKFPARTVNSRLLHSRNEIYLLVNISSQIRIANRLIRSRMNFERVLSLRLTCFCISANVLTQLKTRLAWLTEELKESFGLIACHIHNGYMICAWLWLDTWTY